MYGRQFLTSFVTLTLWWVARVNAQQLVVFDAGCLATDMSKPHMVVLLEKDFNSAAWSALEEKIERYGASRAFDDPGKGIDSFDWDEYVRDMEKAIEDFKREGNEEGVRMFREILDGAKKERAETEQQFNEIRSQVKSSGEGLDRDELRKEVLGFAVGGRFYYTADIYLERLACVRARARDNDENVYGLMDAKGNMVIPARYWTIYIRDWPNKCGKSLIIAYRMISDDKFEVNLFWDDGMSAARQTFAAAKILDEVSLIGVRFEDGGWGLMNADARVVTSRRYKKFDWNSNDLIDSSKGKFVYGERDGVNYIISPEDGSEIGTFKSYTDEKGVYHHDVKYFR